MLEIREKLDWSGLFFYLSYSSLPVSLSILKELAPIPPVSWQHPCPDGLSLACPAPPSLIISGHCYRHLCSSRWPPAGDAGLFCCSTCGHPAARALRSTGTLRSLPAPKPTPAGRGEQTSPGTATTSLLSEERVEEEGAENGWGDSEERHDERRKGKEARFWGRDDEQSYSC